MQSDRPQTTYIGVPVCSLHPGVPWGRCVCAPRRSTKREVGEAIALLKNEVQSLRSWAELNVTSETEFISKLAEQRARKADRLAKAVSWIEIVHV